MATRYGLPLAAVLALGLIGGCSSMKSEDSDTSGTSRRAEAGTTDPSTATKRCADGTMKTVCPEDTSSAPTEATTPPSDTSSSSSTPPPQ